MASFKKLKEFNEARRSYNWLSLGINIADTEISEEMVFNTAFEHFSAVNVADRSVELPGMIRAKPLIEGAAKKFARDEVESRFTFQSLSDVDDAVMQPIRPETFKRGSWKIDLLTHPFPIFGEDADESTWPFKKNEKDEIMVNFISYTDSEFTGEFWVADNYGVIRNVPNPYMKDGKYKLHKDEWIIITDVIDLNGGPDVTAIQFYDIDGNPHRPEECTSQMLAKDSVKVYSLISPEIAKSMVQMDVKIESLKFEKNLTAFEPDMGGGIQQIQTEKVLREPVWGPAKHGEIIKVYKLLKKQEEEDPDPLKVFVGGNGNGTPSAWEILNMIFRVKPCQYIHVQPAGVHLTLGEFTHDLGLDVGRRFANL